VALGLLTWALTEASASGADSRWLWLVAIAGMATLAEFLRHEHKLKNRALMPLGLFALPAFLGLNLLTFFLYGSLGGLIVLLPFCLIKIEHWSAVAAGASLLPVPLVIALGSRLMSAASAVAAAACAYIFARPGSKPSPAAS
jgi:uncharacterized membrane protein YfhO